MNAARTPRRERAGGWIVLAVLLALGLLAGGGYAAAYAVAGEKVPRATTAGGVEIGGRTETAAVAALREGLADRVTRPVTITVGGVTRSIAPADLGLGVDYAATVAGAGAARSWRPQRLWDYFTGGADLDPVVTVDDDQLAKRLRALGRRAATAPQDGAVSLAGGMVSVTAPVAGATVDTGGAREELLGAFLADDATAVSLPLVDAEPDIDAADVQQAVTAFANPALSAPVTLVLGTTSVRLQPRDYAAALSLVPQDGVLVPRLDDALLGGLVAAATAGGGAPVDATYKIVRGVPKVVRSKPGVTFDPATIDAAFLDAVTRPDGQRQLTVEATVAEPAFTTEDARALGVSEQVSTFTTTYPFADYRNTNIGRAAELVDGTLLMPGQTFSLNDTTGERTRENGFTEGFVISDGIFKEDLGGGVSQLATTTFNAMFFAGLEDVEHKAHSFYIDRYPVGREATVAFGSVDLRFRNDTPYGVLVKAGIQPATPSSQGAVTVSMYSTKVWDVTTTTGDRYRPTKPATRTLSTPDCYPNTGYGGFDIDVVRYFRRPGASALDHQETFHTTYTPSDTVICTNPSAG